MAPWLGTVACLVLLPAARAATRNGYALSFTGAGQIAGTRSPLMQPSNAAVAELRTGLTVMMWLAFNDLTPTRFMPPFFFM